MEGIINNSVGLANNIDSKAPAITAANVIGLVLTIIPVVLRIWSRKVSKVPILWDDWLAITAVPFTLGISACLFASVRYGLGQHLDHIVAMGKKRPTGTVTVIMNLLYTVGITSVKLSALCMYKRIWGIAKPFNAVLKITGAVCILWMVVVFTLVLFTCGPPDEVGAIPQISGNKCISHFSVYMAAPVTNLAIDLVILVLPHFQIWKIQMKQQQKWRLACIFFFGYGVVSMSVVRLAATVVLDRHRSADSTWSLVTVCIPYALEIPTGIFTISLPAIVQLAGRWHRAGFGSMFKPCDSEIIRRRATALKNSKASRTITADGLEMKNGGFLRLDSGSGDDLQVLKSHDKLQFPEPVFRSAFWDMHIGCHAV